MHGLLCTRMFVMCCHLPLLYSVCMLFYAYLFVSGCLCLSLSCLSLSVSVSLRPCLHVYLLSLFLAIPTQFRAKNMSLCLCSLMHSRCHSLKYPFDVSVFNLRVSDLPHLIDISIFAYSCFLSHFVLCSSSSLSLYVFLPSYLSVYLSVRSSLCLFIYHPGVTTILSFWFGLFIHSFIHSFKNFYSTSQGS